MGPGVVESYRRIAAVVVLVVNLLIPPVPAALSFASAANRGEGTGAAGLPTITAVMPPSSPSASISAAAPAITGQQSIALPATRTGTSSGGSVANPSAGQPATAGTGGTAGTASSGGTDGSGSTTDGSTATTTTDSGTTDSGTTDSGATDSGTENANGTTTTGDSGSTSVSGVDGTQTAAQAHGWGQPTRDEEFTTDLSGWSPYDGPGHAGNGRRTPSAATVSSGVLTIKGDANGNSEGMAWNPGVKYGRWEARVRAPVADKDYHAVLLLWPDSEKWPDDGEVDYMENSDPTRQRTEFFLHYGNGTSDGAQLTGAVDADATQWHNWAVEWAPDHITAYLDGKQWWTTTDTSALPPGPMHMTIQLDDFRSGGGPLKPSSMQVDWVHYYPISGTGTSSAPENATNPPPATVITTTTAPRTATPSPTTAVAPTTKPTTKPTTTTTTTAPATTARAAAVADLTVTGRTTVAATTTTPTPAP